MKTLGKEGSMMRTIYAGLLFFGASLFVSPVNGANYVGSGKCFHCHEDQFNNWQASGHPWKLRKVEKVRYSGLPLPPGYTWDDISYVVGGINKKAVFVDLKGYLITAAKDGSEAKTQYNLQDGSWSFYYKKWKKKPYKCGSCHSTAYSRVGNQDGRPGMVGTWKEDGVGCEACHGPGSAHIKEPEKKDVMVVDSSIRICAKCHNRGGINSKPPAKGGFLRHHEQVNEILAGPHKELSCMVCHDPHKRAILAKDTCADCHEDQAKAYPRTVHGKSEVKCIDCHMPKASKSAIQVNKYTGDVRTHIAKINLNPTVSMFETVEKVGKKSSFAKPFVTLDYVCLGCHMGRDIKWAAENAKRIHP